jgi:5'-methylthioadenosine phosphorylase
MREVAYGTAKELGIDVINGGTVVTIQGPRFSTRSESKWFSAMGWEVINMTQYPEGYLARELEMCYLNISLITDYDVGLEGIPDLPPVSHEEVVKVFTENNDKLKDLLFALVPKLSGVKDCSCRTALEGARF